MMRIFNPLNSQPNYLGPGKKFASTAGKRSVNGAQFMAAKPHGVSPGDRLELLKGIEAVGLERVCDTAGPLQFQPEKKHG
jgi:hypothetical protein